MSARPPSPRQILRSRFGHAAFRPGQEVLIRAVLSGRDALGVLPTGGGKSVCYMLPAAILPGLTVVVSPLISLMDDQVDRANRLGIAAAALTSAVPGEERRALVRRLTSGRLRLLLVAPERFHLRSFREALDRAAVSLLAIDEAHCAAEWGYDFRPSYLGLGAVRRSLRAPCLALTATATPRVRDDLVRLLGLRDPVRHVGSFDRPNLTWGVERVRNDAHRVRHVIGRFRKLCRADGAGILYAPTRRRVEALRDTLARTGLPVALYHGGMGSDSRARAQAAFMEGRVRLIVATNAFGMGVDKADVRLVLHWQLPGSLEAYYQEGGRAGRDGHPAVCVAFHHRRDRRLPRAFLDRSRPSERTARRVFSAVRDTVGTDGAAPLSTRALAVRLGSGWTPEAVTAALGALAGAGLLRIAGAGAPASRDIADRPDVITVSVRPGSPDFRRTRMLRREGLRRLAAVRRFATTRGCRRGALLGYFGESSPRARCGRCDRCGVSP